MRHKVGRIGVSEAVSAAAVVMCINGLIDIEPNYAYSLGNSTYVSIPASAVIALALFTSVCAVMKRSGACDLWQLFKLSFGKVGAILPTALICVSLLACASIPLGNFTHVLDDHVYEGVEYPTLFAFLLPAVVFIAYKGLEVMGRTSKIYSVILVVSLAVAFVVSLPRQQVYRMYPLMGDGARHALMFSASSLACFVPPLSALLIFGRGLQGIGFTKRAGIIASIIAAAVCFAVHFMLSRLYTYKGLTNVFMPLCRINYQGIERGYIMWLDKLLVMAWLNGAIISAGYCIYESALLFVKAFSMDDVTPAVFMMSTVVCALTLLEFICDIERASILNSFALKYGAVLSVLPLAVTIPVSILKSRNSIAEDVNGSI